MSSRRSWKCLSHFALFVFTTFAALTESAASSCRVDLETNVVTAEICDLSPRQNQVTMTWRRSTAAPTVVKAIFDSDLKLPGSKFWSRFWVDSGDATVTADDQLRLRKSVYESNPAHLHPSVHAVLDFIANFVESGQKLTTFDGEVARRLSFTGMGTTYTPICDAIGTFLPAIFSVKQRSFTTILPVGMPETFCKGRCGTGCEQGYQWRKNQYTQECLNHDACRAKTGTNMGECEDEFWAAAYGYMVAPDCP